MVVDDVVVVDVVVDDVVVVDVVVVDAMVVDMMVDMIDDHIHFGMYHQLDFDHQS